MNQDGAEVRNGSEVAQVSWPRDADRRNELAEAGVPRLLVVEDGAPPPITADPLEDWVWSSSDAAELRARLRSLADAWSRTDRTPRMDADGLLHFREGWVSVPPVEARLVREFLADYGSVVSRQRLADAGWPGAAPGRNALDVHVLRLRRRLGDLGLAIRTVRSRGYVLEAEGATGAARSDFVARVRSGS